MKDNGSKRNLNVRKITLLILIILICILSLGESIARKPNESNLETKTNEDQKSYEIKPVFPEEVYGVPVHTQLIEKNTEARPGTEREIKYIVIHETDNFEKGTGAKNHANFLSRNNSSSTSWHYTVDDKEIYHHIPDNEIAYHAATEDGNMHGIGIELCVNNDGNFDKTFDNAAKLVAYLLKAYNLTIDDVKTHHDFSGKDCPHSILKANRMPEFKRKVEAEMKTSE